MASTDRPQTVVFRLAGVSANFQFPSPRARTRLHPYLQPELLLGVFCVLRAEPPATSKCAAPHSPPTPATPTTPRRRTAGSKKRQRVKQSERPPPSLTHPPLYYPSPATTSLLLLSRRCIRTHLFAPPTPFVHHSRKTTVLLLFTRSYAKVRKMPPKKAAKEEKIMLGRPGNNLKSGIVGFFFNRPVSCIDCCLCMRYLWGKFSLTFTPLQVGLANVGKSTLFQAITKCSLGNPAVRPLSTSAVLEIHLTSHRPP